MGSVIVITNLTLDGVMQAPASPDEDLRDGFAHGGWAAPFGAMMHAGEAFAHLGGFLFGRRTYENFHAVWPERTDSPFSAILNHTPKFVASATLKEPLPWANSTRLTGDVPAAVARLKRERENDLIVFGSGELVRSLMATQVIDRFVLLIHPLVLGSGRRLFEHGSPPASLTLQTTKTTDNGVVIATYGAS